MPIYDNDGTTSREIGKLYDYNGTTSSQTKEVYDFDGTTSRLIYKDAPDYLFNWGDNTEITGGWSVKNKSVNGDGNGYVNASSLQIWNGSKLAGMNNSNQWTYIHTNKMVDFTELKSVSAILSGAVTLNNSSWAAAWWGMENFGLALSQTLPDPNQMDETAFPYKAYTSNWVRGPQEPLNGPSSITIPAQTFTIDTASITGSYYVLLVMSSYDCWSDTRFTFTQIPVTS